eukprot:Skav230060  [mRNA]  locus=scaffold1221:119908:121924:- [translate_table: standard]
MNSCKGGSNKRTVTGLPSMILNSSVMSSLCITNNLSKACRRSASSVAKIICLMATIRCPSKNMCSVRTRPMPSAPNSLACRASAGVSALARTFMSRTSSAHCMMVPKDPESCGGTVPCHEQPPLHGWSYHLWWSKLPLLRADHGCHQGWSRYERGSPSRHLCIVARLHLQKKLPGCTRRGREALGNDLLLGLGIQSRMQELVDQVWLQTQKGLRLCDQAFVGHVDRNLQSSRSCTLSIAGLQHVEFALLDGKLNILHILVVSLELASHREQLLEDVWHDLFQGR